MTCRISKSPDPAPPPADDDEDDYMSMSFTSQAPAETSLQRIRREKLEAQRRGMIKSKAQLAAEAAEAREKALSRSLMDDPSVARKSKGFAMMAKMGFRRGDALGKSDDAPGRGSPDESTGEGPSSSADPGTRQNSRTAPISVNIKADRGGIGLDSDKKRRLEEEMESSGEAKRPKPEVDPVAYRDRVRQERQEARLERQLGAAMRVAERLDEENQRGSRGEETRPLKSINVLWRGLVKARETSDRDKRLRRELEEGLSSSRLPDYSEEAGEEDADDKMAFGRTPKTTCVIGDEELDEEDEELDEFQAKETREKLEMVVRHLRKEHLYCFWCKCAYEDEEMDGCPGETEDDHD